MVQEQHVDVVRTLSFTEPYSLKKINDDNLLSFAFTASFCDQGVQLGIQFSDQRCLLDKTTKI